MPRLDADPTYIQSVLLRLINTPSPSGRTDAVVHVVCQELEALGISFEITRRGAIRANIPGVRYSPDRAIISHLDTLGCMVKDLKPNGRLELVPIGTWSARMAEGARVTVYADGPRLFRGSILPLKASGHVYNDEIDSQPVGWTHVELRLDEIGHSRADLEALGIHVGDYVAVDPCPEVTDSGFIISRHLDDKAGVACVLAAARAVTQANVRIPVDCHLLFTISEEVGVGASHILHGDVAEMVSVDNGTLAPGQNTSEFGVTIAMQDSSGPFDWHLTHKLIELCRTHGLDHSRDVFRYYRSDAASALEAGNDIRTALVCFACDGSHGYERTHIRSLQALAELLALYMQSDTLFKRDVKAIGPVSDFPKPQVQGGV